MDAMNDTELPVHRREARARMMHRRRITAAVTAALAIVLLGSGIAWAVSAALGGNDEQKADTPSRTTPAPSVATTPEAPETTAPQYDIDSPGSFTVVVNKQRALNPIDWAPDDLVYPELPNNNGQPLRAAAAAALEQMDEAATADGFPLIIASAYRSYSDQDSLFERYAASDGVEEAETYSARPGHSEHQTGLAVDLTDGGDCTLEECFGETATGAWLRDHAWRFGYILRYNNGEQPTVGYLYEPWHFRYVGTEVSTAMHEQGVLNLEDFFGLPAAPTY